MLKVMTIVGTRPELIKMSRVINEFDNYTKHILVHTGQNFDYELNQIFFDELQIRKPDYFLNAAKKTAAKTIASVIEKSDELFSLEHPDALLLYGDTNSCLAIISAKRHKIPVFHMEAGNRCFDQRVPEELNRKIIDHLSDINLVLTEHARRYLIAEGIGQDRIIKTGSHMKEVLIHFAPYIEKSTILVKLNLIPQKYFLISAHREENIDSDKNLTNLLKSLSALSKKYNYPIIVSTHPRTWKNLQKLKIKFDSNIKLLKPFGFFDYVHLQKNAFCVLSDSGTITEEASLLNIPAITIRKSHERPEGMDEGVLIMSDLKSDKILNAVELMTQQYEKGKKEAVCVSDYMGEYVSKKILRIVISYTDFVKQRVWFQEDHQSR